MDKTIYYFFILFIGIQPLKAQIAFQDTIPYHLIDNKIIIETTINQVKTHFIFDTGGQNIIMIDSALVREIKNTNGSTVIGDMNRNNSVLQNVNFDTFGIGQKFKTKNMNAMLMENNASLSALGVSGILGGQAFGSLVVTILPRQQLIVLSYPYRPKGINLDDSMPLRSDNVQHPFVKINIQGQTVEALFDTGAENLLMLAENDYQKLKKTTQINTLDSAFGIKYVGIGGLGNPKQMYKVKLSNIRFGNKTIENVGSITIQLPVSIVGYGLLEYGNITIDFPREKIYFIPFETQASKSSEPVKEWNVEILPVKTGFQISNVWSSAKNLVKLGERVANVNGTPLDNVDLSMKAIQEILSKIKVDHAFLIIGEKGNERKVNLIKE